MDFLIALVIVAITSFLFRNAIKRLPWLFYLLALLLSGIYLYSRFFAVYNPVLHSVMEYPQRGLLGMAAFTIVMFIGVFPNNFRIRRWLEPIRAELSLFGCLLIVGHASGYLISYIRSLSPGLFAKPTVAVSLAVSIILLALLLVLGITTIAAVRQHMSTARWIQVQRLSYPFYGLVFLHLLMMLLPSVQQGATKSITSLVVYILLLATYITARLCRAYFDKRS